MSYTQDAPLPNPDALPQADKKLKRRPTKTISVKHFFKKLSIGRLFARKKALNGGGNQIGQGQPVVSEPEEMHEMQEIHRHGTMPTEWVEPQHYCIQRPHPQYEPQTQPEPQHQPQPEPQMAQT